MTYANQLNSWIAEGAMDRNCILQRLGESIMDFTKDEQIAQLYQKYKLFGAVDNGALYCLDQTTFLGVSLFSNLIDHAVKCRRPIKASQPLTPLHLVKSLFPPKYAVPINHQTATDRRPRHDMMRELEYFI